MINVRATTTDTGNNQIKELLKRVQGLKDCYVTVGVHEGAGAYADGTTVAEVALWTEFGTKKMPERSWFRSVLDEKAEAINAWRLEALNKIIFDKMPVEKALGAVGFRLMTLVQNKIKSNVPPQLAESTVKAKEREGVAPVTLMYTKLMLRSVGYQVYVNGAMVQDIKGEGA